MEFTFLTDLCCSCNKNQYDVPLVIHYSWYSYGHHYYTNTYTCDIHTGQFEEYRILFVDCESCMIKYKLFCKICNIHKYNSVLPNTSHKIYHICNEDFTIFLNCVAVNDNLLSEDKKQEILCAVNSRYNKTKSASNVVYCV